jgi:hypothetical protein
MDLVTLFYLYLLGQAPDLNGYRHWKSVPVAEASRSFASAEVSVAAINSLPSDGMKRRALSNVFFNREPEPKDSLLPLTPIAWATAADHGAIQSLPEIRRSRVPAEAVGIDRHCINTYAELLAAASRAKRGETICLSRGAIIHLPKTLRLPPGVSLSATKTTNSPFERPLLIGTSRLRVLELSEGCTVENLWIAGSRWSAKPEADQDQNIPLFLDPGSSARGNWVSNYAGFAGIYTAPGTAPCLVEANVVDASASFKLDSLWSDGISAECTNTMIRGNVVIDSTDVAIILFGSRTRSGLPQSSKIIENTVFNGGLKAFAGIALDPGLVTNSETPEIESIDFSQSEIARNRIISPNNQGMTYGIGIGTSPWFGELTNLGWGGSVSGNVIEGSYSVAMIDAGMVKVKISGDDVFRLDSFKNAVLFTDRESPFPDWYGASAAEDDLIELLKDY